MISVCVSTFNRASLLREMLDSLVAAARQAPGVVTECIIARNGCTDNTYAVVLEYESALSSSGVALLSLDNVPALNYIQSYTKAIRQASNRFVWLFADDDQFCLHALSSVKPVLEQYGDSVSVICANWQSYEFDFSAPVGCPALNQPGYYPTLQDYLRVSDLMRSLSFLSSLLIRSAAWLDSRVLSEDRYFSTDYQQVFILLETSYRRPVYALAPVVVKNRLNYRFQQGGQPRPLPVPMRRSWERASDMLRALEELHVAKEIVDRYKASFVRSPQFLFQWGLLRSSYKVEFPAIAARIKEDFGSVNGFRTVALAASVTPGIAFRWFATHRDALRRAHRLYATAQRLLG